MIPISTIFWYFFLFISLYATFSTVLMSWNLAFPNFTLFGYALAAISTLITLVSVLRYNNIVNIIANLLQRLIFLTYKIDQIRWIAFCAVTGIAIRITWFHLFPPQFRSDYATYFTLARNLFEYGSYSGHNLGFAYWPPGYPLFLYIHFHIFGVHSWVPLIANLWLFIFTLIVIFFLSKILLLCNFVLYYSLLLLVLWPTYIASVTLPSKEMIIVLFIPLSILLTIASTRISSEKYTRVINFSIGLLSGFMSLTQPSMLFFLVILLFYQWTSRKNFSSFIEKSILMLIGSIIVITPWTIRNYRVLNEFVFISTNGGDVFYRANNPIATGGYLPAGERSLEGFDEVNRNKVGYQWGIEWILENPLDFLRLALQKQVFFLGDDGKGVYETLKRGLNIVDVRYFVIKAVSNLYWLILWIFIFLGFFYHRQAKISKTPEMVILISSFLYLFLIHSVFESGGKHHEPLMGILAIFATLIGSKIVE